MASFPLFPAKSTSTRLFRGIALAAVVQVGAVLGTLSSKPAEAASTLYSTDFDSPAVTAPGVTATPPISTTARLADAKDSSYCKQGWCGKHLVSGASQTFVLNGLPSHDYLSFNALVSFLNSWDSTDGKHGLGWAETVAPDYLGLYVDGNPILEGLTYNNASGTQRIIGPGVLITDGDQLDNDVFYTDTLVRFSDLVVAHTSSTLTLEVKMYGAGIQGYAFGAPLPDEAWGLDDLLISYGLGNGSTTAKASASAPGPLSILGAGVAFGLSRRVRNRLQAARR